MAHVEKYYNYKSYLELINHTKIIIIVMYLHLIFIMYSFYQNYYYYIDLERGLIRFYYKYSLTKFKHYTLYLLYHNINNNCTTRRYDKICTSVNFLYCFIEKKKIQVFLTAKNFFLRGTDSDTYTYVHYNNI